MQIPPIGTITLPQNEPKKMPQRLSDFLLPLLLNDDSEKVPGLLLDNMKKTAEDPWMPVPSSESVFSPAASDNNSRSLSVDLPRPPIINDAILIVGNPHAQSNPTMYYVPPKYIANMHAAPRFGHTNVLGEIASKNHGDAVDYAQGLKQFTLLTIVPFIIWGIILVLFKFIYGIRRIGCAAGGEVLDIKQLSKQGVSRKIRKRRIIRSWRLQSTFVITGILIPTTSFIMMQSGWSKVQVAWEQVQLVINDVETLAYKGWHSLDGLKQARDQLHENRLVQDVLNQTSARVAPLFASWCPKAQNAESLAFLEQAMSTLEENTKTLVSLFDTYLPQNSNGFIIVTEATQSVSASIAWFFKHDWIWKMYIMALNVLNVFLVLCCYIFSKHNIIHPPTRFYLTFWVVPLFTLATVLMMMVTASSGIAVLLNADFCAGGDGPGSPTGTIRDAILSYEYGSVDTKHNLTGTLELVYESFSYYANGCLTANPLAFLQDYANKVDLATSYMVQLSNQLPNSTATVNMLSFECGADMSFLPKTLMQLETQLLNVQTNLNSLVDVASCQSISPLVRRLTHGAICGDSAHGLTWIWACCLAICGCCFVMLTTRSALYNAIKKRKPRDHKSKRAVEREFEEYKEFMSEYYDDAPLWKLEHLPKECNKRKKQKADILEIDFESQILQPNPTFETEVTTKPSMDEEEGEMGTLGHCRAAAADSLSRHAGVNHSLDEDGSSSVDQEKQKKGEAFDEASEASSYDSDYESDSDEEDDESGDDESALLSFFAETRSIFSETKSVASSVASKALQKIRNIRPLLGKPKDDEEENEEELFDEGFGFEDNSLFLPSPPGGRTVETLGNKGGDNEDGLWKTLVTPPSRGNARTPTAPQKPFSFLGRTSKNAVSEAAEQELAPLTHTPDATSSSSLRNNQFNAAGVHPRRLKLSPFLDAKTRDKTKISPPERRHRRPRVDAEVKPKANASERSRPRAEAVPRVNRSIATPQRPRRARASSEDSSDISLYIEDVPKPPEKAIRRLPRTSDGTGDGSSGRGIDSHQQQRQKEERRKKHLFR